MVMGSSIYGVAVIDGSLYSRFYGISREINGFSTISGTADRAVRSRFRGYERRATKLSGFVLAPLGPGQRWAVASPRAGYLPLAVETGRYWISKVPLGGRVCESCSNDKVETEFHNVMECSELQNL